MSLCRQSRSLPGRLRLLLASFLQRPGLLSADALPEEAIRKAFDDENASFADNEDAMYTLAITLWAFLSQVLFEGVLRSCVAAGARVMCSWWPWSHNSGAASLIETALANLPSHIAHNRPGRVEPRAVKRRPNPRDPFTKPRGQARTGHPRTNRRKSLSNGRQYHWGRESFS